MTTTVGESGGETTSLFTVSSTIDDSTGGTTTLVPDVSITTSLGEDAEETTSDAGSGGSSASSSSASPITTSSVDWTNMPESTNQSTLPVSFTVTADADGMGTTSSVTVPQVSISLTIGGVSLGSILQNDTLLLNFQQEIRERLAAAAGGGVLAEHVAVLLSAGSVKVDATISMPPGAGVGDVADSLAAATASGSLASSIIDGVTQIPGIDAVQTGELGVTGISAPVTVTPVPSQPAPISTTTVDAAPQLTVTVASIEEDDPFSDSNSGQTAIVLLCVFGIVVVLAFVGCLQMRRVLREEAPAAPETGAAAARPIEVESAWPPIRVYDQVQGLPPPPPLMPPDDVYGGHRAPLQQERRSRDSASQADEEAVDIEAPAHAGALRQAGGSGDPAPSASVPGVAWGDLP